MTPAAPVAAFLVVVLFFFLCFLWRCLWERLAPFSCIPTSMSLERTLLLTSAALRCNEPFHQASIIERKSSTICFSVLVFLDHLTDYYPKATGGHRHRSLCRRYPTSDIDISYSDMGKNILDQIPSFPYQHQVPFRYQTKLLSDHSDIFQ